MGNWYSREDGHLFFAEKQVNINSNNNLTKREPHKSMSEENPRGEFEIPIYDKENNEWRELNS